MLRILKLTILLSVIFSICVVSVKAQSNLPLDLKVNLDPSLSRDGNWVYFGQTTILTDEGMLVRIHPDGTSQESLPFFRPSDLSGTWEMSPVESPEGTLLATLQMIPADPYGHSGHSPWNGWISIGDVKDWKGIYLKDYATMDPSQLDWSPDGTKIGFSGKSLIPDVCVYTLATDGIDCFQMPGEQEFSSWGEKGIYFTQANAEGRMREWILDPKTGKSKSLFEFVQDANLCCAAETPDGGLILKVNGNFSTVGSGSSFLPFSELPINSDFQFRRTSWSADGEKLVFSISFSLIAYLPDNTQLKDMKVDQMNEVVIYDRNTDKISCLTCTQLIEVLEANKQCNTITSMPVEAFTSMFTPATLPRTTNVIIPSGNCVIPIYNVGNWTLILSKTVIGWVSKTELIKQNINPVLDKIP